MTKDSFIFYKNWYQAISKMSDAERLKVYETIIAYSFGFDAPEDLSDVATMAMNFILPQLQRDIDKYNKICERNQRNGAKGGRPKSNPKNPLGKVATQKNPVVTFDNDNDNHSDNDNGCVNDITHARSNDPAYIEELINDRSWQEMICMKTGLSIDNLLAYLHEFKDNVQLDMSNHRDRADFRSHVRNWLLKQSNKVQQDNVNEIWQE